MVLVAVSCSTTSPTSTAGPAATGTTIPTTTTTWASDAPGVEHLDFSFGPLKIAPGQNNITVSTGEVPKPKVDGWIVGISPDLRRPDGSVPPVDIIHLHHGVWLNLARKDPTAPELPERFFASGEEKTVMRLPKGYGYRYTASEPWLINYMLHNALSSDDEVSITYRLDFIAADSPLAAGIKHARPIWMDVQNGSIYPVFDVIKGSGNDGTYTFPDDAKDPYPPRPARRGRPAEPSKPRNEWVVDRDGVLLNTAAHLHPGGLHGDMYVRRGDKTVRVFRSEAVYYEPAGPVSWDVSMTATPADWRVALKKGDVVRHTITYNSKIASWYESMGIMVAWMADAADVPPEQSPDPFERNVDVAGAVTHGHLPENDNHGGQPDPSYRNALDLPSGPVVDTVTIVDFSYLPGDMQVYDQVPVVRRGTPLKFVNQEHDVGVGIWHTITACKAPCDRSTGVAYPLADADRDLDSGELGVAGPPTADRFEWATPPDLPTGTYTYFCRIHPGMRGFFRVED